MWSALHVKSDDDTLMHLYIVIFIGSGHILRNYNHWG
jgi:hypothetical protein